MSELNIDEMKNALAAMCRKAVAAGRALAVMAADEKNRCLNAMADAIEGAADAITAANEVDMKEARAAGLSDAMLDRLKLTDERIRGMADGLRQVASQQDPVGKLLSRTVRPNGLTIDKVSVPIGVIGIIYESRPNVTADAAGICIKAGNTVILRGGSEAIHSNRAIADVMNHAAIRCGLPDGAVQLVPWTDRAAVNLLVKMDSYISLIIPRGGEGLIRAVVREATIPVIKHYKGVCHIYIDKTFAIDKALEIVENAKCQRPSACNAVETLLIDRNAAASLIPPLAARLREKGVEIRGDEAYLAIDPAAIPVTADEYGTEYLDLIVNVRIVDGVRQAVEHINLHGSGHSDAILSNDEAAVAYFLANVDSATVYHNASTRFTDGGEFGMGAEIGISTDKLHARGPMGADELTSYKYLVRGNGQIR